MDYRFNKYGTFFLFLLLSFTLWFVYRYQEDFSQTTTVHIDFTNVPDDISFHSDEPLPVKVNLTSSGFRLLKARYFPPIVSMDYLKSVEYINGDVLMDLNKNLVKLKEGIGGDYVLNNVAQEIVEIPVTFLKSKKIKVSFNPDIIYKNNLVPVEVGFVSGDSVLISGDQKLLNTIGDLNFENKEVVVTDTLQQVLLDARELLPDGVIVSSSKMSYNIRTVQMTEGTIELKVMISGIPENVAVKRIPSTINVVYTVPLEDYDSINAADFNYTISFDQLKESVNIIPVEIQTDTERIHSIRTIPSQIKVLVIR